MDDRDQEQAFAGWEHFHHVADVGVRGLGANPAQAFEQAAVALTAVITDPGNVRPAVPVEISCESPDREMLLADWLNAVVFEMATRHMLFSAFEVEIRGCRLSATARGEAVDTQRHRPATDVKGATLSELRVAQRDDGLWLAQCVVDV